MLQWLPQLTSRSLHVRFHRRGGRHDLPTPDVERTLDDALLEATDKMDAPARISFEDPDIVIAIDTIDRGAGVSLWHREDLARHSSLRPD